MANGKVHFNPDKYKVGLSVATLLDDSYVTAQDIEEVLERALQILKIKYPDIN